MWECSFRKDSFHCVKYYMRISSRRLGNLRFSSISEHSGLRIDAKIRDFFSLLPVQYFVLSHEHLTEFVNVFCRISQTLPCFRKILDNFFGNVLDGDPFRQPFGHFFDNQFRNCYGHFFGQFDHRSFNLVYSKIWPTHTV